MKTTLALLIIVLVALVAGLSVLAPINRKFKELAEEAKMIR